MNRSPIHFTALCLVAAMIHSPAAHSEESNAGPIASALQPLVDAHTLAGAVTLVADKEKIVDVETVGYSDIASAKRMHADDLFWIASESKPITATAFMMLVDEGKININDPVEKYLPEFKGQWLSAEHDDNFLILKRPSHPITIKNILSHTSGLPFSSRIENPTLDLRPLSERVLSYALSPLEYQPDTKYQYSNAGINTAGRIIEVVSGMPYEKFLEERLFKPLGMKDTTFWPEGEQLARIAKSYKPGPNNSGLEETTVTQLKYPLDDRTRQPMPAGGLFSTAADVARFAQMILNGGEFDGKRYLSESAIKQMTSKQTPESIPNGYGFGWSTDGRSYGHGGAYSTDISIHPEKGLITVFMVQHAGFPGDGGKSKDIFVKTALEQFGK